MKITKGRLKQILLEEMELQRLHEGGRLKDKLKKAWQHNDRQTASSFRTPEEVTAVILTGTGLDWEDVTELVDEASEEYNNMYPEAAPLEIDMEDLDYAMREMARQDHEMSREDDW